MNIPPPLRAWLADVALPGRAVAEVRELTGGHSNQNLLITTSDGRRHVLRRYLRNYAGDVERALAARVTGTVPVAEVVAADPDLRVLLSVFVPGRLMSQVIGDDPATLGRSAGRTLAAVGSIAFDAPGFLTDGTLTPEPPGAEPAAGLDVFVRRCLDEGNAGGHLTAAQQRALLAAAERGAEALTVLHGSRRLVHADYNPKNLLVAADGRVTAVLDWEFAFSGAPLTDVGNMLRDPRPVGFAEAFVAGFREAGGSLPDDWRRLSRALDLYSLADFLTRPPDHRYFRRAVTRIQELTAASR